MPKNMPKTKNKQDTRLVIKVTDEIDNEAPEAVQAELHPEIIEALNAKKLKKVKVNYPVDYIPELERDEDQL